MTLTPDQRAAIDAQLDSTPRTVIDLARAAKIDLDTPGIIPAIKAYLESGRALCAFRNGKDVYSKQIDWRNTPAELRGKQSGRSKAIYVRVSAEHEAALRAYAEEHRTTLVEAVEQAIDMIKSATGP